MNHITIEFCKEDRQRIDELVSIASLLVTTIQGQRITPEEFAAGAVAVPRWRRDACGPVRLSGSPDELQSKFAAQHPADATATHLEAPQPEPVAEEPKPEPVAEEPKPEPTPAAAPIVIPFAEFQKAVTLAVSKGPEAKKAAKAIINKYAPSVSEVPEDKRSEVVAELAKI